jgi:hypothetical protein
MFHLFDVEGHPQIVWPHELSEYESRWRLIGSYTDVHALIRDFEREKARAEKRPGRVGFSARSAGPRGPDRPSRA